MQPVISSTLETHINVRTLVHRSNLIRPRQTCTYVCTTTTTTGVYVFVGIVYFSHAYFEYVIAIRLGWLLARSRVDRDLSNSLLRK